MKQLQGFKLLTQGQEFAKVKDVYFDVTAWVLRYLVVDTGGWLASRKVLLPPDALEKPDWNRKVIPVTLNRKQIENSPPLDADLPVSRQHEADLYDYYGWESPFWARMGAMVPRPERAGSKSAEDMDLEQMRGRADEIREDEPDPSLRALSEVMGYRVQANDGDAGHVEDFYVDDATWDVRYVVVDTRKWLPGRHILLAVPWIDDVNWAASKITVDLTTTDIVDSPEWDPEAPINREYEDRLFSYYDRPRYW